MLSVVRAQPEGVFSENGKTGTPLFQWRPLQLGKDRPNAS